MCRVLSGCRIILNYYAYNYISKSISLERDVLILPFFLTGNMKRSLLPYNEVIVIGNGNWRVTQIYWLFL